MRATKFFFPIRPTVAKSSWPELLGQPETQASATILQDRPDVFFVEFFSPGSPPVVPELNSKRVLVFTDGNGLIPRIPIIG